MKVQRKYYSKDEREEILKRTDGLCAHCGKKLNADNMTVEHIIPLYKGGKDDKYNIIALCEKCNKDKNNYTVYFDTYYKYINENEERYYLAYSNTKTNKFKDDSLFYFDRAYMEHLPYSVWHIASEMKNRGASKSKIDKIVQKGLKTVIIEKAFENDCNEIWELFEKNKGKNKNRVFYHNTDYYNNKYEVRNHIAKGYCYIIRDGKKIIGAITAIKLNDDFNVPQVRNISEQTRLKAKAVVTQVFIDSHYTALNECVMPATLEMMVRSNTLPLFFCTNEDEYRIVEALNGKMIHMQYNLNNVNGTLMFYDIKSVIEKLTGIKYEDCERLGLSENDFELISKYNVLGHDELSDDDLEKIAYLMARKDKDEAKIYKEIICNVS